MANPWNEPAPRMDENFISRIILKTDEYLTLVQWRNDCEPATLDEAVNFAKMGKDGGKSCTMNLRPNSDDFHEWMQWSALVTYLFNRDTDYARILSVIRKP